MACVIVSNVTSVTQNPSASECECEVLTANIGFIYHCIETGCQISHRSQYLVQNLRRPRSQATLPDRIHPVCTVLYCTLLYCTVVLYLLCPPASVGRRRGWRGPRRCCRTAHTPPPPAASVRLHTCLCIYTRVKLYTCQGYTRV